MKPCFCMGAALLLAVACSKEVNDVPASDDRAPEIVFATISPVKNDTDTKVYLGEDLLLHWNSDDHISYFDKETYNYEYYFTGSTGDRSGELKKVKSIFHTGLEIEHVYAVYPYDRRNSVTEDEVLTVYFPSTQDYAVKSFGPGANLMVAVSEDNNVNFKNLGGFLCIKLYGKDASVSSVSLTGNGGEILTGQASVTMEIGGTPETRMEETGGKTVTISCDEPIILGESAEDYSEFWFVVPPVTFSQGFTVMVGKPDGTYFEKKTSKSFSIERNVITSMVPVEVE